MVSRFFSGVVLADTGFSDIYSAIKTLTSRPRIPFFDPSMPTKLNVPSATTAVLSCRVHNKGNFTVSKSFTFIVKSAKMKIYCSWHGWNTKNWIFYPLASSNIPVITDTVWYTNPIHMNTNYISHTFNPKTREYTSVKSPPSLSAHFTSIFELQKGVSQQCIICTLLYYIPSYFKENDSKIQTSETLNNGKNEERYTLVILSYDGFLTHCW